MFYSHLGHNNIRKNIAEMYGLSDMTIEKAEEMDLLNNVVDEENNLIEKGRKGLPIGSRANWNGKDYLKTAKGWKLIGKESGNAKQANDYLHKPKETKPETKKKSASKESKLMKLIKDAPKDVAKQMAEYYGNKKQNWNKKRN